MTDLTPQWVWDWHTHYNVEVDEKYYDPYIEAARRGDKKAITALTRWKNVGKNGLPMNLSKMKQKSLDDFFSQLDVYLQPGGEVALRADFKDRAPVWSIFWAHVLYGSPIFDRYTLVAFQLLKHNKLLIRDEAVINSPDHWKLFDQYKLWFDAELSKLRTADGDITGRTLDRALFCYGEKMLK